MQVWSVLEDSDGSYQVDLYLTVNAAYQTVARLIREYMDNDPDLLETEPWQAGKLEDVDTALRDTIGVDSQLQKRISELADAVQLNYAVTEHNHPWVFGPDVD